MPTLLPDEEIVTAPIPVPVRRQVWREFGGFTLRQVRSCAFAGPFLLLLAVSSHWRVALLPRYDLLFVGAILIQAVLIRLRLENLREVMVLSAFHVLGMALELYKTSPWIHSWSYPEHAYTKVATVPLYSGFMYAAVASYMMQAWRVFDLKIERFPPLAVAGVLCAAIYANFFTEHFIGDYRIWLFLVLIPIFGRTRVTYTVINGVPPRRMPLLFSFALIGGFVWIAENVATFCGAWVYPNQHHGWAMVHGDKIGSWDLLVIISFVLVALLKNVFPKSTMTRDVAI